MSYSILIIFLWKIVHSGFLRLVFRPFNVQAKLIMTLKPRQQNFERPMFHLTIDLDQMSLNLTRSQVCHFE